MSVKSEWSSVPEMGRGVPPKEGASAQNPEVQRAPASTGPRSSAITSTSTGTGTSARIVPHVQVCTLPKLCFINLFFIYILLRFAFSMKPDSHPIHTQHTVQRTLRRPILTSLACDCAETAVSRYDAASYTVTFVFTAACDQQVALHEQQCKVGWRLGFHSAVVGAKCAAR
jgi:hypothetical protein